MNILQTEKQILRKFKQEAILQIEKYFENREMNEDDKEDYDYDLCVLFSPNILKFVKADNDFIISIEVKRKKHGEYFEKIYTYTYDIKFKFNEEDYETTIKYEYEGGSCSECDPIEKMESRNDNDKYLNYIKSEIEDLKFFYFNKITKKNFKKKTKN